ncbi:MAG: glycosyltransferase family 4 protein [Methylobacter sp.]
MNTLLSINNYYYRRGGAEVLFLEHNRLFEAVGWQALPFCMRHPQNLTSEWAPYFVDEIEFGRNYSAWEKARNSLKIIYSLEARDNLRRLIGRVRPDIAHAHNIYHHLSPSFFSLLKDEGIPTVLTLHDLKIACPAYKMLTHDGVCERCKSGALWNVVSHKCVKNSLALSTVIFAESLAHRLLGCYSEHVDRFVVPSRFYLDKLVEWGWPRERFVHIPNFVDIQAHRPGGDVGRAFIYFGRLGPEKGLGTLVRAAALSKLPVWVVGTGPEQDALKQLASELAADVRFFGYQAGESLHELVRSARAVVLPSEWYENAPMSVMEAYALERPVLGANIGGIPEMIRTGETGDVFASGNAADLAELMTRYAAYADGRILAMGRAGRVWATEEFTAERYRERMLDLYGSLIGKTGGSNEK